MIKGTERATHDALEAQAAQTVANLIEVRARAYALCPRELDAILPNLSAFPAQRMAEYLRDLLAIELNGPITFGRAPIIINLRAAIKYAERLLEIENGSS